MKNRFVISENDRRSILSMYGLLKEEEKSFSQKITGYVIDSMRKPVYSAIVVLKKQNDDESVSDDKNVLGFTYTDEDGKYSMTTGGVNENETYKILVYVDDVVQSRLDNYKFINNRIESENPIITLKLKDKLPDVYLDFDLLGIIGKLKIDVPIQDYYDNITTTSQQTQEKFENGPKGIKLDIYKAKQTPSGVAELSFINSIFSEEEGVFESKFNLPIKSIDFNYIQIRFEGNDIFDSFVKNISTETIKKNNVYQYEKIFNVGNVILKNKTNFNQEEVINNFTPFIGSYCKNFKVTKNKIYGLGVSQEISNDDALNKAIINMVENLIKIYPIFKKFEEDLLVDKTLYKIVCDKASSTKREVVVQLLFKNLKKYLKKKEDIFVDVIKINFKDLTFIESIKESLKQNKNIFLVFSGNDTNSKKFFEQINSNKLIVDRVNNEFIPLNYVVDISQKEKYLIASETLKTFTYPYLTIIKAKKNPDDVEFLDMSFDVIKKIGLPNDLINLNHKSF
jgi:hypothetical protein